MSRIAYVNGRYRPMADAMVHIEDRGYQFADGVYDVCEVRGGYLVAEDRHFARLESSLAKTRIAAPVSSRALRFIAREVVRRNRITDGLLYVQVTRGVAPRGHAFPKTPVPSSLVVTARRADQRSRERAEAGIAVITVPETRWARTDIKTIGLLPNVLAKQLATEANAAEAWFVDIDGQVNEGASSNAWIVTAAGSLVTSPTTAQILEGITRGIVIEVAETLGLKLDARRFSVDEAKSAREAFITSATTLVTPVTSIDNQPIGDGSPGQTAIRLRRALIARSDPGRKTSTPSVASASGLS